MKTCSLASIREHAVINRINAFLATPYYVMLVMLLTAAANLLELELLMYTIIAVITVYTLLLGENLLPLMPVFIAGYVTPSRSSNPGRNPESFFYREGGIYLIGLAIIACAALAVRAIQERQKIVKAKPKLLWGMLALSAAYLLSGVGSEHYAVIAGRNILYAVMQIAALLVPYLLVSIFADWKNVRKDYLAWVGFSAGCLLCIEIIGIYCTQDVIVDGIVNRDQIYTGWGMYNNMGGMLAVMIPFAFGLATHYRKMWIGIVAGSAFLGCVLMTCSRSSILTAGIAYGVCGLLMLHYAKNRRNNIIVLVSGVGAILFAVVFFREQLMSLFRVLVNLGFKLNNRDIIYRAGLDKFLQSPILGGSFYSIDFVPDTWSTLERFISLIPPRWHNTIVQILASCGAVGMLAYLFHRIQTVKLFVKRMNKENSFIACSIMAMLIACMFDCHLFNIGPTLFYSMALGFAENS